MNTKCNNLAAFCLVISSSSGVLFFTFGGFLYDTVGCCGAVDEPTFQWVGACQMADPMDDDGPERDFVDNPFAPRVFCAVAGARYTEL